MRQYRRIARSAVKRRVQTVFRGYRSGSVIGSGECSDMKNLTSDDYPLLSVRKARYAYAELDGCTLQDCIALHSRSDHPVVCNNFGQILCHGHTLDGLLVTQNGTVPPSMLPKKMVSMGAWCVIFPDKVWFDALKLAEGAPMQEGIDFGALDNEVRVKCGTPGAIGQETVRFTSVLYDGTGYVPYDATQITYGQAPPTAPEHSSYWCDTSQPLARMLVYDAGLGAWNPVQTTYVRITATDRHGAPKELGKGFRAGDGISIRGLEGRTVNAAEGSPVRNHVFALNGMHTVAACDKQTLIIKGCIGTDTVTAANALVDGDIVIARLAPDMDYVVECGNRLWGCKYGEADGVLVNELYASKLGDFTNWQSYQGISTDSYTASRGGRGLLHRCCGFGKSAVVFSRKQLREGVSVRKRRTSDSHSPSARDSARQLAVCEGD